MATIRLLGAESNGINNYFVDEPDYNSGPLDLNRTSQFSEHRQAMALLKNELRSLAYEVILAEGLGDLTMGQRLALTMFYRSLQTHEAIEILLKQKLAEDALLAVMLAFSGLGKLRLDPRIVRIIHEVVGVPL